MHSTILVFLDGVGIGKRDKEFNPFFKKEFKTFHNIFGETPSLDNQYLTSDDIYLFPVDACMGVEGIPQSGTGQTSIFCGVNAPEKLGFHFGPYPHSGIMKYIKNKSVFADFKKLGYDVAFANAYPKIFFDYINSGRKRLSATSLSCLNSGVRLNNSTDLRNGNALSAEIDNSRWVNKLNYKLPIIKPQTAAKRLFRLAEKNHFVLYEFFLTDHIGHFRIKDEADYILSVLDDFLFYLLSNVNDDTTLIICSDHGNVEDLSVKMHTRNPALTITAGKNSQELSEKIKKLSDIKNNILGYYK